MEVFIQIQLFHAIHTNWMGWWQISTAFDILKIHIITIWDLYCETYIVFIIMTNGLFLEHIDQNIITYITWITDYIMCLINKIYWMIMVLILFSFKSLSTTLQVDEYTCILGYDVTKKIVHENAQNSFVCYWYYWMIKLQNM